MLSGGLLQAAPVAILIMILEPSELVHIECLASLHPFAFFVNILSSAKRQIVVDPCRNMQR